MEKKKFYIVSIICLVILNIILLGYIYKSNSNHPAHPKTHGPKNFIIKKLDFDKFQQKQFDVYISKHQHQIRKMEKERFHLKTKLYQLLTIKTNNSIKKDSLIELLALNHSKIEQIHFQHFLEIKRICKKNQLEKYNQLSKNFSHFFAPVMHRKR